MTGEIFSSWAVQDGIVAALVLVLALVAWRLSRREFWRVAFREVVQNRLAVISAFILCAYVLITLLDSVGWCRPLRNPDTGEFLRAAETGQVVYDSGCSALDYMLAPLELRKEKSYSAPFAREQFTSVTRKGNDGRLSRVRESLAYPGTHVLGTDIRGADVLLLSIKGVRTGLIIGLVTTLLIVPFALIFGLAGGYYGGFIDDGVQYLCTLLSSIPSVLLISAMMVIFGRGLPQLCIAMGITSWVGLCRLIRGEAMRLREADFTQAAVALGVPSPVIILRHLLPNVMHIVVINIVLGFSGLVLTEATLTYLGLGVDADTMSWGAMINDARTELTREPIIWWKLTGAFVFMMGLVLPANIFGDAVRDALDPRLRRR